MVIGGKIASLADCMVAARIPDPKPDKPKADEHIWVAYDDSRARLPVAIAPTAQALAEIMGVSVKTVYSTWSKYQSGELKTAKYAKVDIGDNENG
jgi:hypothetical protein